MGINDKYLVSGSRDESCVIWKLPDFKPVDRLIIPDKIAGLFIYNDYIACPGEDGYIGFENQVLIILNIMIKYGLIFSTV